MDGESFSKLKKHVEGGVVSPALDAAQIHHGKIGAKRHLFLRQVLLDAEAS